MVTFHHTRDLLLPQKVTPSQSGSQRLKSSWIANRSKRKPKSLSVESEPCRSTVKLPGVVGSRLSSSCSLKSVALPGVALGTETVQVPAGT